MVWLLWTRNRYTRRANRAAKGLKDRRGDQDDWGEENSSGRTPGNQLKGEKKGGGKKDLSKKRKGFGGYQSV